MGYPVLFGIVCILFLLALMGSIAVYQYGAKMETRSRILQQVYQERTQLLTKEKFSKADLERLYDLERRLKKCKAFFYNRKKGAAVVE
jgi:hypothetical protein